MPLQRSSNPALQRPSLPPITFIPCKPEGFLAPSRPVKAPPTDLRWIVAEEFLKARSLSPTSFATAMPPDCYCRGSIASVPRPSTRHRSLASLDRYAKRAKAVAAERAFFSAIGERSPEPEQGRGEPSFVSQAPETPAPTPADSNLEPEQKTATVILWLRVENNNKFIRQKKKIREQIERLYLSAYQMKHLEGWEYDLTIPYSSEQHLDEQIEELLGEMSALADNHCCFIEADVSEVGGERNW